MQIYLSNLDGVLFTQIHIDFGEFIPNQIELFNWRDRYKFVNDRSKQKFTSLTMI
jgi:hypothetical protein